MRKTREDIARFLLDEGWSFSKEGKRFIQYTPPNKLGLPEGFFVSVPVHQGPGFEEWLNDAFVPTIQSIYGEGLDVSFLTEGEYLARLRERAIYLSLKPIDLRYQNTVTLRILYSFLRSLSISYLGYASTEFQKRFLGNNYPDKLVAKSLRDLSRQLEPRAVDFKYGSFRIAISSDFIMDDDVDKDVRDWKKGLPSSYQNDVLSVDYNSEDDLFRIIDRYSSEERSKIYKPILESIKKEDYTLTISNKSFEPIKEVRPIARPNFDRLIPEQDELAQNVANKKLKMLILEAEDDGKKTKKSLEKRTLFEQDVKEFKIPIQPTTKEIGGRIIRLKEPIEATVSLDENLFLIVNSDLRIEEYDEDLELAKAMFLDRAFKVYYDYAVNNLDLGDMNLSIRHFVDIFEIES